MAKTFCNNFTQNCTCCFTIVCLRFAGMQIGYWSHVPKMFSFESVFFTCLTLYPVPVAGGNVVCLELWGRQSAPYMQALHFSFGLGAFVAPLVAAPFLSTLPVATNGTLTDNVTTPLANFTTTVLTPDGHSESPNGGRSSRGLSDYHQFIRAIPGTEETNSSASKVKSANESSHDTPSGTGNNTFVSKITNQIKVTASNVKKAFGEITRVHYAYLLVALYLFIVSLMFFGSLCYECVTGMVPTLGSSDNDPTMQKGSRGFHVQLLLLMFFFYFFYVGAEVTYGGFIMEFAVASQAWPKVKAAMLTSVFWGMFAFGRGIAIFLARCLSPTVMLVADLVLSVASLGGLVLTLQTNPEMLWFCTAVLGLSMASIFPTGITWAERYIEVGGKTAAVFVAGSALGEMSVPLLVGFLFKAKGPMWLMYVLLAGAVFTVILFIIMHNLAANRGERYRLVASHCPDDTVEMESLLVSDSDMSESPQSTQPLVNSSKKHVTFNVPNVGPSPVKRKVGMKND